MRLKLPSGLRYPITVTELLKKPDSDVAANEPIFKYTYTAIFEEDDEFRETHRVERTIPAKFESEAEGKLSKWMIKKDQIIHESIPIAEITEACTHEVQIYGHCAICGKDLTLTSGYNSTTKLTDRADVAMVHDNSELRVSANLALKAETEAKRRLINSKKLSLVVDLDMTIIHATVDPTVAEWQQDPKNPNYAAVEDVQSFKLKDSPPATTETTYYIKMRPGLKQFLTEVSKTYELHIYTMGTRAYAEAVAKIVDPEKKFFSDRILSRDESGSMTAKSLQRLFPVDQKMVVIIDDRSDVWHWSKNLIRVSPFDFFTGSGDINASFLPPKPKVPITSETETHTSKPKANGSTNGATATTNGESALDQLIGMGSGDDAKEMKNKTEKAAQTIENQVKERPLAQKQLALDQKEESESQSGSESDGSVDKRQSLLDSDDRELTYIESALRNVHKEFYEQHAQNLANVSGGRLGALRPGAEKTEPSETLDLEVLPDVKDIMSAIKERVFVGCSAVFSGVVAIGKTPQETDTCVWAMTFGLKIRENLRRSTTHLIAVRKGTAKVKLALRSGKGKIKVVNTQWLMDSILRWKMQDEGPYLLHGEDDYISPLDSRTGVEGDEAEVLSDSEDPLDATLTDGDTTDGERSKPTLGKLRTKKQREVTELEPDTDEESPDEPFDDKSPIGGDEVAWEGMEDELAEFLDDDDDSDTDNASVASEESSQRTDGSQTSHHDRKQGSKRRLEEIRTDADGEDGPRKRSRGNDTENQQEEQADAEVDEDDWDALMEQEEEEDERRRSAENSPEQNESTATKDEGA